MFKDKIEVLILGWVKVSIAPVIDVVLDQLQVAFQAEIAKRQVAILVLFDHFSLVIAKIREGIGAGEFVIPHKRNRSDLFRPHDGVKPGFMEIIQVGLNTLEPGSGHFTQQ